MAEHEISVQGAVNVIENPGVSSQDAVDCSEPPLKKSKTEVEVETEEVPQDEDLEQRLNDILCCSVCLDLPVNLVYQCVNGHLMCAGCFTHVLADARLKDEQSTCPNCRCEISRTQCSRNLAVEKAVSELPSLCQHCACRLPRNVLEHHQRSECPQRISKCGYASIGCLWKGPNREVKGHEKDCEYPGKTGAEVLAAVEESSRTYQSEIRNYQRIIDLLSFEKLTFNDLQLRPYRTDDFITKLYYETSRFTALNQQWVLKARINDSERNPLHSTERHLTYQLLLKSRISNPLAFHFMLLGGPFTDVKVRPEVYRFEFTADRTESPHHLMPLANQGDGNKLLSAKTINVRLLLFQVQK
ncbi:cysteine and histidine-rich protein 1-like [Acanthaster planci]|uniref:Cysteine and histidine-rich protein 1-like n=1 Tax=Acanthaster planci TaxID=133434 RepID=A0A8B7XJ79_ACAPL|nr:cysteine and histidine-rich protein 1-like [Acanthaster planci]